MMVISLLAILLCLPLGMATALGQGEIVRRTRNAPGMTDAETMRAVGRALNDVRLQSRDTVYSMNRTSLAKSWDGATLFKYDVSTSVNTSKHSTLDLDAGIDIVCSTCYVNGSVIGDLTLTGDFNFTEAFESVKQEAENITEAAIDDVVSWAESSFKEIVTLEWDEVPVFPTLNVSFNMDDVGFSEASIHFEFDNLELYLEFDVELSAGATYTLNLFTSETPAGFSIPDLNVGALFVVDLILIVDAEIDVETGIHILLDEGLVFDIELFSSNVSSITVPGGQFEVLPVTVDGEGSIQAILSLTASFGVEMDVDVPAAVSKYADFSAGMSVDIFAYLADFLLQVNATTDPDADCELAAVAEYTMAIGGAAGATVAVDTYSWGPSGNTTVPVFYTTLASICATNAASSSTTAGATVTELARRAPAASATDMSLTAVTTTEAYTIVNCLSTGLINCPANLQNTTKFETTMTSTVTVSSGADATYPASVFSSVTSAIAFGSNANKLAKLSGSPSSYTPTTSTASNTGKPGSATGGGGSVLTGKTDGTSNKLIIGLSVGLGAPFLIGVAAGAIFFMRKRKPHVYAPTAQSSETEQKVQGTPSTFYDSPITPTLKGVPHNVREI